jgi:hypothetical protein
MGRGKLNSALKAYLSVQSGEVTEICSSIGRILSDIKILRAYQEQTVSRLIELTMMARTPLITVTSLHMRRISETPESRLLQESASQSYMRLLKQKQILLNEALNDTLVSPEMMYPSKQENLNG